MACIVQFIVCLALIAIGLAVLVGEIKRNEALARIGMLLAVLLLGPAIIAVLMKQILLPAVAAVWSAAKPVLLVVALIFGLLLVLRAAVGALELFRNRNSGEHRMHSKEE
jgi:hypothetical protein